MADIPILSSIFGSKPQIADYTSLDFSQEQLDALMGDLAAFPQISALGADFQKSYLDELNTAIPGFSDILAEGGTLTKQMESVAGTELSGELPPDVAAQVQRTSAFQNLQSGAGGGMANANTARNYGLTSLDLINQGANMAGQAGNAAQRWAQLSGAGASANVMAGMTVTPQQRAEFDKSQNLIKQAVQQAKYNVAAAPDPIAKGLSDIVENLTAAYLGGKVGSIGAGNAAATQAGGINYNQFAGTSAGAAGMGTSDWQSSISNLLDGGSSVNTGGGTFGGAGAGSDFSPPINYGGGLDNIFQTESSIPVTGAGYNFGTAANQVTGYNPFALNLYGTSDFNFTTRI